MRSWPNRTAFTLAELVLAIALISVVGLSVATVASALANAYRQTDTMKESIQSGRSAMMNVASMIRKAKLLVAKSNGALAIWTGDANGDDAINVDELVLIRCVQDSRTVESTRVAFPGTMPREIVMALNEAKQLLEVDTIGEVRDTMNSATLANHRSSRVLASDVHSFSIETDVDPPYTRLALIRITVGPPDQRIALTSSVHLRADAVDQVVTYDGVPALDLEKAQ